MFVCLFSPADFSPRDYRNNSQLHVSLWDLKQSDGAQRGGPLAGVHRFGSVRTAGGGGERSPAGPGGTAWDQAAESPVEIPLARKRDLPLPFNCC